VDTWISVKTKRQLVAEKTSVRGRVAGQRCRLRRSMDDVSWMAAAAAAAV